MSLYISNFKKYFLIFLLSNIIFFAVSIAIIVSVILTVHKKDNTYLKYIDRFKFGGAPIIIIGDSHAARALPSNNKMDNLAQPGDNLNTMEQKIKVRIRRGGVNAVILSADPQIFSLYRITAKQDGRLLRLNNDDSEIKILIDEYKPYMVGILFDTIKSYFQQKTVNQVIGLGKIYSPSSDKWKIDASIRAQLHKPIGGDEINAYKNYENIIKSLRVQGISVCMVTFPVSSAYREESERSTEFLATKNFFLMASITYKSVYFDASSVLDDDKFSDPDHINVEYSQQFASMISRRCGIKELF